MSFNKYWVCLNQIYLKFHCFKSKLFSKKPNLEIFFFLIHVLFYHSCWLKIDNYFILSFVVPVGIIILVSNEDFYVFSFPHLWIIIYTWIWILEFSKLIFFLSPTPLHPKFHWFLFHLPLGNTFQIFFQC